MDIEWLNIPFLLPGIFRGTHPKHWFLFWYNVESVNILSKFDWVILKISTFDWVILKTCNTWYSDETFPYKGTVLLTLTSSSQGSTIHFQAPENAPNIRNYQILSSNVRKTDMVFKLFHIDHLCYGKIYHNDTTQKNLWASLKNKTVKWWYMSIRVLIFMNQINKGKWGF